MKRLYQITTLYILTLIAFAIYSYTLIDPNITLLNNNVWATIRETLIHFGYYQRELSVQTYSVLVILLFAFHLYFVKHFQKVSIKFFLTIFFFFTMFSYPFLSHDLFNYMFDAKILTYYHQNPYLHKPQDFPSDLWLRFMHWTHRTYPYGPVFLAITLIPAAFGMGKFLLSFMLFKLVFFLFYALGVYSLSKLDKKWAVIFATNPLVLVEGLVSVHNDLIGVTIALYGICLLNSNANWKSRLVMALSSGIKYMTIGSLLLFQKNKPLLFLSVVMTMAILGYVSYHMGIQPWYYLTLFMYLPFFSNAFPAINFLFLSMLLSYYPYIRYGSWSNEMVVMKDTMIYIGLVLSILYFFRKQLMARIWSKN